jgi:hypothetical protein
MGKTMENIHIAKQKLLGEIEHLPNPYIVELQNFIQYLKFKQSTMTGEADDKRVLRPEDDPILRAFGLLDVPPFSEAIDDALYGAV